MSAITRELQDNSGNKVYPVTKASAVYMPNGVDTVARILGDQIDQNTTIEFSNDTITMTLASGSTIVVVFGENKITETTTDENGVQVQVKVTTFNEDGSITITINGEEEEEE